MIVRVKSSGRGGGIREGGRGGDAVVVDFYWSADQLFFKSTGVVG